MRPIHLAALPSLAVTALLLSGCATGRLGAANDLSTVGSKASATMLGAAQQVQDAFTDTVRNDSFLRALQTAGVPAGSSCSLISSGPLAPIPGGTAQAPNADVDKVATALRARVKLATALGKTYSAMGALAKYDASGAVEGGIADVFDATNQLGKVWGLSAIPDTVSAVVPTIGGALVQRRQAAKLKAASIRIRTALGGYRDGLKAGQTVSTSVLKDGIGETYALRIALWRRGYLDANGFLSKVGSGSDLSAPTPDLARFTASDDALCRGVRAALESERDGLRSDVNAEYQAQIDVIEELIEAHAKFESGAELNLVQLAALLDRLSGLAGKIAKGTADAN